MMSTEAAITKFVGAIVTVLIERQGPNTNLVVQKVLGSGFVVNKDKAIVATCCHVLPEEDRNLDIGFYCKDGSGGWFISLVDTSSIQEMDGEDLLVFQCLDHNDCSIRKGFETLPISGRDLLMAEKVIFAGIPTNHLKISRPGDTNVTSRVIVGFVSAVYEKNADINSPLIKTMSGGPVISSDGEVIGIALKNVLIGLDVEMVNSEVSESGDTKEEHVYSEYQRFGFLFKSQQFLGWLRSIESQYSDA